MIADGAVAIRAGRIAAVGPRRALERRYRARRKIEARGDLVLPGLVNAHTHVAMTLLARRARRLRPHDMADEVRLPARGAFRIAEVRALRRAPRLLGNDRLGNDNVCRRLLLRRGSRARGRRGGPARLPGAGHLRRGDPRREGCLRGSRARRADVVRVAGARARDTVAVSARRLHGRARDAAKDTCSRGALRRAGSDAPVRVGRRARDGSGALRHDSRAAFRRPRRPRRAA